MSKNSQNHTHTTESIQITRFCSAITFIIFDRSPLLFIFAKVEDIFGDNSSKFVSRALTKNIVTDTTSGRAEDKWEGERERKRRETIIITRKILCNIWYGREWKRFFKKCASNRISDRHKQRGTIPLSSIVFQMSNYCSGRPDSLLSEHSFVFLHR